MLYFLQGEKGKWSMPTELRIGRFRFHFYSDESGEPAHIHVAMADGESSIGLIRLPWPAIEDYALKPCGKLSV